MNDYGRELEDASGRLSSLTGYFGDADLKFPRTFIEETSKAFDKILNVVVPELKAEIQRLERIVYNDKPFWTIWADDEIVSHWRYYNQYEAVTVAKRLAKDNPSKKYYLLYTVFSFENFKLTNLSEMWYTA